MTDTVSAPHDAPIAHVADTAAAQPVHTAGERDTPYARCCLLSCASC